MFYCTVRDVGTSTLPWTRRGSIKTKARGAAFSQVSSLKQRLVSLQIQVRRLTEARDEGKARNDELVVEGEKLRSQISAASNQLASSRFTIQVCYIIKNTLPVFIIRWH